MRKIKLITMLFMLLATFSFSQNVSEVVDVDSTAKKETLYSNALSFFATSFKSAQDVIQMKDPETGKIIGKGLLSDGRKVTITISCKDGRYKYDIQCDELKETRLVEFSINKCGVVKGHTYLPIYFIGNTMLINVENSYFQYDKTYSVQYNGEHNIMGLSKTAVDKWRIAVDDEFKIRQHELYKMKPKKDEDLEYLITTLKSEMSKSEW